MGGRDKGEKYESRHPGRGDNVDNDDPHMKGRDGRGNRGDGWAVVCLDNGDEGGTWIEEGWGGS